MKHFEAVAHNAEQSHLRAAGAAITARSLTECICYRAEGLNGVPQDFDQSFGLVGGIV
jgi:hypothetical protein